MDWAYKFSCLPFDKQMRSLQRKMKDFQNLYIVDSKSLLIKNYSTRFREYKPEKKLQTNNANLNDKRYIVKELFVQKRTKVNIPELRILELEFLGL